MMEEGNEERPVAAEAAAVAVVAAVSATAAKAASALALLVASLEAVPVLSPADFLFAPTIEHTLGGG